MPSKFTTAFEGQEEYLAETIDVESGSLYLKLQDRSILKRQQVEHCKKEPTSFDQVTKLLGFLRQADDKHFEPFCVALEQIGQTHVAKSLRNKLSCAPTLAVPPVPQSAAPKQSTRPTMSSRSLSNSKCPLCGDRHVPGFPWKFQCFFNVNRLGFIEKLDVGGNFFEILQQERVLDKVAIEEITYKGDEFAKKRELVKKLEKCDDHKYDSFLDVLDIRKQSAIFEMMNGYFSAQPEESERGKQGNLSSVECAPELNVRQRISTHSGEGPSASGSQRPQPKQEQGASSGSSRNSWSMCLLGGALVIIVVIAAVSLLPGTVGSTQNADVKQTNNFAQRSGQKSFADMLKGKRKQLMDSIAVSPEFWALCHDKGLLTGSQIEECKKMVIDADKVDCVFKYLVKRDTKERVSEFCSLLSETEQGSIIDTHLRDYCEV